jgi:rod shape-determining protein MreB
MMRFAPRPSRRLVYVQISPERILLRRVATGETIDDVPQAAVDAQGIVVAYGRGADDAVKWHPNLRLVNGFSHPRTLMGDVDVAAATLRAFLETMFPRMKRRLRPLKPDLVIHPLGPEDLSGLEVWGLQRVAELAGARHVSLWQGEEPAYETLVRGTAQPSGAFRILGRLPRTPRA